MKCYILLISSKYLQVIREFISDLGLQEFTWDHFTNFCPFIEYFLMLCKRFTKISKTFLFIITFYCFSCVHVAFPKGIKYMPMPLELGALACNIPSQPPQKWAWGFSGCESLHNKLEISC